MPLPVLSSHQNKMVWTRSGRSTNIGDVPPNRQTFNNDERPQCVQHFLQLVQSRGTSAHGQVSDLNLQPPQPKECTHCSATDLHREQLINQHGNPAESIVLTPKSHPPARLCSPLARFLDKYPPFRTPDQIAALTEFQRLVSQSSPLSLMARSGLNDARAVHQHEMEHVLNMLSDIFFPSRMRFRFVFSPTSGQGVLSDCTVFHEEFERPITGYALIRIHSLHRYQMNPSSHQPSRYWPTNSLISGAATERLGITSS